MWLGESYLLFLSCLFHVMKATMLLSLLLSSTQALINTRENLLISFRQLIKNILIEHPPYENFVLHSGDTAVNTNQSLNKLKFFS